MTTIESFDPAALAERTDPSEHYRWLRDEHPMHYSPTYDMWFISRFDDIWRIMGDTSLGLHGREVTHMRISQLLVHNHGTVPPNRLDQVAGFPSVDPPEQGTLRGMVNQPFRPGAVKRLEDWFRTMVRSELPAVLDTGCFNLTDTIGQWTTRTMCRIAGIPPERARRVRDLVNEASDQTGDPMGEFDPAGMGELFGMMLGIVAERRAAGADGSLPFIDKAIASSLGDRALTDAQITNQLMSPLVGGIETVPKVTAHGLWELSKRPDQLAAVRADLTENASRAFEESARFCGPAQSFHRTATKEVEVLGRTVQPGQRVAFLTASAGRDPREFADADEFHWDREFTRTLSFGQGDHFCMGIHLARMEGKVLLQEFLSTVEEYEIDAAHAVRTMSTFQQGWDELPVRIISYRNAEGDLVRPAARDRHDTEEKEARR